MFVERVLSPCTGHLFVERVLSPCTGGTFDCIERVLSPCTSVNVMFFPCIGYSTVVVLACALCFPLVVSKWLSIHAIHKPLVIIPIFLVVLAKLRAKKASIRSL